MFIRPIAILFVACACAGNALAQTGLPPKKPVPEQPAPVPRAEPRGQAINVRVEVALTAQTGSGEPLKKIVTMLAADGVRSSVRNEVPGRGFLHVDAVPQVLPSGVIRISVGLEYMPGIASEGTEGNRTQSRLNEQVTVFLESGKPVVISQAADPTSDRTVTAQVTATVMK